MVRGRVVAQASMYPSIKGGPEMMASFIALRGEPAPWSEEYWAHREQALRRRVLSAQTEREAWRAVARDAREVLRAYSTGFFTVTRFLPPAKRRHVEAIYAAVRYPDEIVDTFPWSAGTRLARLNEWRAQYERALAYTDVREMVADGAPCFLAGFVRVMWESGIPADHYRAFLDAMALDVRPRAYATLDDLVESYIYGSAIVVGYFLAHVYGPANDTPFSATLQSARHLGIALQLTNFLRDTAEDQARGRQYLPVDMLSQEGISRLDTTDVRQHEAIARVLVRIGRIAEQHYAKAAATVDVFAPDSRTAIRACIDVYGELNRRIVNRRDGITRRESVPFSRKLRVLPPSKYWRLPLAFLGW